MFKYMIAGATVAPKAVSLKQQDLRLRRFAASGQTRRSGMSQLSLLQPPSPKWERIELPDGDVRLLPGLFSAQEATALLQELRESVHWRQDKIRFYGKEHDLPRLQQWHGDLGLSYTWSGITMSPEPWSPLLLKIKGRLEQAAEARFNTVLLNLYRDGNDTVSWHADNEEELGPQPVIGSVSLGAEREFILRHNTRADVGDVTVLLPHGSLLLMAGSTQACWKHSLPRRKRVTAERINLTFRRMFPHGPSHRDK
jgi:alkylated DNA repair dioxygenase AlkB